jgi:hypothetical protein
MPATYDYPGLAEAPPAAAALLGPARLLTCPAVRQKHSIVDNSSLMMCTDPPPTAPLCDAFPRLPVARREVDRQTAQCTMQRSLPPFKQLHASHSCRQRMCDISTRTHACCECGWRWFRTSVITSFGGAGGGALGGGGGGALAAGLLRKRKDILRAFAVSLQRQPPAWRWAHRCYLLLPTTRGVHGGWRWGTAHGQHGAGAVRAALCSARYAEAANKPCIERASKTNPESEP